MKPVRVNTKSKRGQLTISVNELSALLNRSRMSVYADLKAGLIPCRRLRGRYVLSRNAIMRWLEGSDGAAA